MALQERAQITRRAILSAAAQVFDDKGFDGASIADVIEVAGTTRGALYFHFSSKEDLARAIVEEQVAWISTAPAGTDRPLQEILDITYAFAEALRSDPLIRASVRLTVERGTFHRPDPESYRMWEEGARRRIAKAKRLGQVREQWSPIEIARLIAGSFTGLQLASEVVTGRTDLTRRLDTFWRMVLPQLVTPEHLPELTLGGRRL